LKRGWGPGWKRRLKKGSEREGPATVGYGITNDMGKEKKKSGGRGSLDGRERERKGCQQLKGCRSGKGTETGGKMEGAGLAKEGKKKGTQGIGLQKEQRRDNIGRKEGSHESLRRLREGGNLLRESADVLKQAGVVADATNGVTEKRWP